MKKQFIMMVFVAMTSLSFAQSNKEDIDLMQAALGKDKKALYAEFMILEAAQKDAFWTLYDEYETKRKEIGKKRVGLLEKYVKGYETMTDVDTEASLKEMMSMQSETNGLIDLPTLVIEEVEPNLTRISLRSKSERVNVNEIAKRFGGGGHSAAAGARIEGTPLSVQRQVITAIKKALNSGH